MLIKVILSLLFQNTVWSTFILNTTSVLVHTPYRTFHSDCGHNNYFHFWFLRLSLQGIENQVPRSTSILGLTVMNLLASSDSDCALKDLILKYSQSTSGMKVPPSLSWNGQWLDSSQTTHTSLRSLWAGLVANPNIISVQCSFWATPIVTPQSCDGKNSRICGDYRPTVNRCLKQSTCTTAEPENILNKLFDSNFLPKINLKDAHLQIHLDEPSMPITTIE